MNKWDFWGTILLAISLIGPIITGIVSIVTEYTMLAIISAGILALGLIITAFIKVFKKPKKKKIPSQDNQDQNKQ